MRILASFLLWLVAAPMVSAQSVQDQIVTQLQAQGFTRIEVSRTILGRVQLKAFSNTLEREMVFNPTTGEILRDFWEPIGQGNRNSVQVVNPSRSSGSGSGSSGSGSRDDDRRDRDNDRAERANSGNGSGNAGRGNRDDDKRDRADRNGSGGGSANAGRGGRDDDKRDRDDDDDDDDDDRDDDDDDDDDDD